MEIQQIPFLILGNYLGTAWLDILKCISQLELAQLIGTGVRPGLISAGGTSASGGGGNAAYVLGGSGQGSQGSTADLDPSVKESIGETSSQSVVVAVSFFFVFFFIIYNFANFF